MTLEKLLYRCVFYPIAKGPSPRTQQRDQNAVKNTQLDFYYYLSYICVDLIYLTCLILLKSPWWPVWRLCAQDLLKRTLLSSVNLCVIKPAAIFKEYLSLATSVSEKVLSRFFERPPKLCRILSVMKHYKKMSMMKNFLRKLLSLYFDFLLTDL